MKINIILIYFFNFISNVFIKYNPNFKEKTNNIIIFFLNQINIIKKNLTHI